MRVLYVDLEREWRGGQSQAFLTVKGLRTCGHDAHLLAVRDSPLARRAEAAGVPLDAVGKRARRADAALLLHRLLSQQDYEVLHANEPHALTSAWLARAHKRLPLLISRRIGFPLQKNWVSQARFRAVDRFVANSQDVAQSLRNRNPASGNARTTEQRAAALGRERKRILIRLRQRFCPGKRTAAFD